ncbi:acyl-CoA thioesterase [Thermoactinomyces mirandus]|uniref:Acyl-CoA thioesterase n=1 Tax=Thermoactinomyces mirandus TaxID=2756294 RepID=A0A7W1XQX0_9BACL|nr:thioesterase family protein [Thermoactinomyces mirandus]MBA4601485.1 acyl-CoA thioesterase [Thermoactinomyces mirandus]
MKIPWITQDLQEWIKSFRFFTPIQVRFCDTDQLGHINNVSYFSYFEHGRLAYLQELNLIGSLLDTSETSDSLIVSANMECHYLRQVYYGENVTLGVRISRIGKSSADFEYALVTGESRELSAVGRGAIVYIDRHTGKSKPLPEKVKNIIRSFEESAAPVE